MNERNKKLSKKTIVGYGFGALADAAAYNFYIMYALYFLTTVAGMAAARAGVIISVSTVISAIYAIVIGPISDATKSRFGRRRPYILIGGIIMLFALALFFKPLAVSAGAQFGYYMVMFIILNMSYGTFLVPYNALGAEMTDDYDERTRLRTPATFMNCVGNIVGISIPLAVIAIMVNAGASDGQAWNRYAILVGIVCLVSILITWLATRGKELPPLEEGGRGENPLLSFWQIIKLKPFKYIIIILLLFAIGYMVFNSGLTYYVLYCAGLTEAQMSTGMLIYIFMGMGWTVVISILATHISKQAGMALCFIVSAIGMAVMYFVGVHSLPMLCILLLIFGLGNGAYWLLIYPIIYDLAELYEYKYGERKEGALMSVYGFIFTIATAIGTQVLTLTMTAVGYDETAEVMSQGTMNGISAIVLLIPVVTFVVSGIIAIIYPMTKEKFELLKTELEHKRAGEEVHEEDLKRII